MFDFDMKNSAVLIVETNRSMRRFLTQCFRDLGAGKVEHTESGTEAITMLRSFKADLVVMALELEDLDGIELTRLLRTADNSPAPTIPIIMLTNNATRDQLGEALRAGVHSFLAKPVTLDKLRRHVVHVLGGKFIFLKEGDDIRPIPCGPAKSKLAAAAHPGVAPALAAQ